MNIFPHHVGSKKSIPKNVSMVPKVEALVPAWIRLKESGILIIPKEPRKRKIDPISVIIAPIYSNISILQPFLQVFCNNKHS